MYTKEYFIKKVEKIKPENFTSGEMGENGCHCMLGHCGIKQNKWIHTKETIALSKLIDPTFNKNVGNEITTFNPVINFNDNGNEGATLKERWLKKLRSL